MPSLTVETLNSLVRDAQYAVRGPVVARAAQLSESIKKADEKRPPFDKIIPCNIGNPHALGQKPITFLRQVLAACMCPSLLEISSSDVALRAQEYLKGTSGGVGAYTETEGLALVRKQVADFINKRDGFISDPGRIMLTGGASEGIKRIIQAIVRDSSDGIMIPSPQYPLYSCQITLCGGKIVYYPLEEKRRWGIDLSAVQEEYLAASDSGINLRAIVVINPGNPTGNLLSYEDIVSVIKFAAKNNMLIMADEVYQANVYREGAKFLSFKKVLSELKRDHPAEFDDLQLVSFHSTSKGLHGECGLRGGYMELVGFDDQTYAEIKKLGASSLSSTSVGQIACGIMVTPPQIGDPSYDLFISETSEQSASLKRRAVKMFDRLNAIPGFSCQPIDGAMYAFPQILLPEGFVNEAVEKHMAADEWYCMRLVEETGIVCVPGSGFGQEIGTNHIRITILPSEKDLDNVLDRLADFHCNIVAPYY